MHALQAAIEILRRKQTFVALLCGQLLTLAIGLWIGQQVITALNRASASQMSPIVAQAGSLEIDPYHQLASGLGVFCWVGILQAFCLFLYESQGQQKQAAHDSERQTVQARLHSDLVRTRDAVIFGLAKLAESRDSDTGQHLERIAAYSTRLAQAMRRAPEFREQVSGQLVQDIGVCSALHDIGKVAVEDAVLLKPGPLTVQERRRMQVHPRIGANCIEQIERRLGEANFLSMAREIALAHHERWDGGGYPSGLSGQQIPLAARIVAITDVYDAMSSQRVYKNALPHDDCVKIIVSEAGHQFDPQIVGVFQQIEAEFRRIRQRYLEPEIEPVPATRSREFSDRLMSSDAEQRLLETLEHDELTTPSPAA